MPTAPLKTVRRNLKHVFTPQEIADLNIAFRMADKSAHGFETEFDSVKASYKAKITEAESRKEKIGTDLDAGFELRDEACVVVMDFKAGKKFFFVETMVKDEKAFFAFKNTDPLQWPRGEAAIVEDITDADRQQQLIDAESQFEAKEDIELFPPVEDDNGVLTVGRLNGKWFSALRVRIGAHVLNEYLDGDQPCSKKRPDQVKRALKDFGAWLEENLGREESKGFKNAIELVMAEQAEREE
jgi:hypothetical protein